MYEFKFIHCLETVKLKATTKSQVEKQLFYLYTWNSWAQNPEREEGSGDMNQKKYVQTTDGQTFSRTAVQSNIKDNKKHTNLSLPYAHTHAQ